MTVIECFGGRYVDKNLLEKIAKLEYHQRLLLEIIDHPHQQFNKLVIECSIAEKEVEEFNNLCESMNKEWEEQKAEGFVYFQPLFQKFKNQLHVRLQPEKVISACIKQRIYLPLMEEFKKYL